MNQGGLTKEAAYDQARKEHYNDRHRQEIESRIAKEEALAMGAQFGASALEIGMQLESSEFDRWKTWAQEQVTLMEQARSAAYTGLPSASANGELDTPGEGDPEKNTSNAAAELVGDSIPSTRKGQEARGGAAFRP
jgi:small subunit ribosomal protein S23